MTISAVSSIEADGEPSAAVNTSDNRPQALLAARLAGLSLEQRELLERKRRERTASGSDLLARSLRQCGITHVYAVTGSPTQVALPALDREGLRIIGVCHQGAAACMAMAHNYQAGRLAAVALVSAGPAISNAVTALLVARENGWPLLVLGGQRDSFQQFDAKPLCQVVARQVVEPRDAAQIPACIDEACRAAFAGRPGPVYVNLHEDVLAGIAATPTEVLSPPGGAAQDAPAADATRVLHALRGARRPALIIGEGVRWSAAPSLLAEIVEGLGAAVITSPMGRGFISDEHPLCFNRARTAVQQGADAVLVIGAPLDWRFRHGGELSRTAEVFVVDPVPGSQAAATLTVQHLPWDPGAFLRALHAAIHAEPGGAADARHRSRTDWHASLRAVAEATLRAEQRHAMDEAMPLSPLRAMAELRAVIPHDAIVVTDGNISMCAAQAMIPSARPASRMDAGAIACMGVGVPFAIGAKLAAPGRPVVVITGDYAFSLCAMELEVCLRQSVPIVVVVINNEGNCGATKQRRYFPQDGAERVTQSQSGIEYDAVMRMFGGLGTTVAEPAALRDAMQEALAADRAACINVLVDPATHIQNAWGEQGRGDNGR